MESSSAVPHLSTSLFGGGISSRILKLKRLGGGAAVQKQLFTALSLVSPADGDQRQCIMRHCEKKVVVCMNKSKITKILATLKFSPPKLLPSLQSAASKEEAFSVEDHEFESKYEWFFLCAPFKSQHCTKCLIRVANARGSNGKKASAWTMTIEVFCSCRVALYQDSTLDDNRCICKWRVISNPTRTI